MRILHISTRLILGGSQENTLLSCEGQTRLGHEVTLAFGPIFGPEGTLLERAQHFRDEHGRGITLREIPDMVRQVSPLRDARATDQLRALIRETKPDVVVTHSSKAGIIGRQAAWSVMRHERRAIGIVHVIHGPPFMPLEGGPVSRARTGMLNFIYTLAERHAARRCHLLVSVADAMTTQYLSRGIGRREQYVTVRSGMEVGPFLTPAPGEDRASVRAGLGFVDGDFVVGTVARLAQHKGHDDVLDAAQEFLRPRGTWKLLWVGDGWWRQRLLEKARGLGVHAHELDKGQDPASLARAGLVLTGLVPPARIPAMMRAMDVLCHPSSREGLPRTVPQALLCGVCPVAYDADGTREACIDMRTGRLVRVGDVAGLAAALRWCHDHPRDRQAMAEHGRQMCAHAFSAPVMVAELEKVHARARELARATVG